MAHHYDDAPNTSSFQIDDSGHSIPPLEMASPASVIAELRRLEAAKPALIARLLEQRSQVDRDLHALGYDPKPARKRRSKAEIEASRATSPSDSPEPAETPKRGKKK